MKINIEKVKQIIKEIEPAKLVAATKYVQNKEIEDLEKAGVEYFGENRVQALLEKQEQYHGSKEFHLIGTLQPNKVKYIIDKVTLIHSVDSYSLIKEIEKQASKHNLVMPILVQVNIAREASKHGFMVEDIEEVFNYLKECQHIAVHGLMMMAPNQDSKKVEKYFKQTKDVFEYLKKQYPTYPLKELSMGMSNDYKVALKYGATIVRIGSLLFDEEG